MNIKQFIVDKFVLPKSLKHCCIDEFLGTYLLIFITILLCWIFNVTRYAPATNATLIQWVQYSWVFGSAYIFLFVLILFFGHGGAFFNPALVLVMWTTKRFHSKQVVCYLLTELVATLLAGLTIFLIAGSYDPSQWSNPTRLGITIINKHIWVDSINLNGIEQAGFLSMFLGFWCELLCFGLFTFAIFQLGKWKLNQKTKIQKLHRYALTSFLIGLFLTIIVTFQIPLTGASCNLFRSLAPLIFESWGVNGAVGWIQFPLYLLSTIIGSQLGVICSTHLFKGEVVALI
ncbi:MAG: aquaporin [Mycoplasmataceae bacterium]|jgi:glycerol uptake facilitator-like aquaporin|nr:aquaporin [Mycoplasmataceae bacterium]